MTTWHLGRPPGKLAHPKQWNVLVVPREGNLSFARFDDEQRARGFFAKMQARSGDLSELFPPTSFSGAPSKKGANAAAGNISGPRTYPIEEYT
jgi:hypothetical protein